MTARLFRVLTIITLGACWCAAASRQGSSHLLLNSLKFLPFFRNSRKIGLSHLLPLHLPQSVKRAKRATSPTRVGSLDMESFFYPSSYFCCSFQIGSLSNCSIWDKYKICELIDGACPFPIDRSGKLDSCSSLISSSYILRKVPTWNIHEWDGT
jgi:hypothetical protein